MTEREIGRETSQNLAEARTILGQAESALGSLQKQRESGHWGYAQWSKGPAREVTRYDCGADHADCPRMGEKGWHTERVWADPDYDTIKAALEDVIRRLSPYRRTGRPRKAKK